jgi:hypothetical protein
VQSHQLSDALLEATCSNLAIQTSSEIGEALTAGLNGEPGEVLAHHARVSTPVNRTGAARR